MRCLHLPDFISLSKPGSIKTHMNRFCIKHESCFTVWAKSCEIQMICLFILLTRAVCWITCYECDVEVSYRAALNCHMETIHKTISRAGDIQSGGGGGGSRTE